VRLLLFGAPASGKGTQADRLSERLGVPQVATGNILRAQVALRTELGVRAAALMGRGELVPDQLMIEIIRVRLRQPDCGGGFLLDGFPRTVAQAKALDRLAEAMAIRVDRVLYLKVPNDELVRRISGRLTCAMCNRSYFFDPGQPHPEACEEDGGLLLVREDDRPATARRRISVYVENTLPILDHYRGHGLVTEIDGLASVDEVSDRILSSLRSPDPAS
jgi:adenylate kinase